MPFFIVYSLETKKRNKTKNTNSNSEVSVLDGYSSIVELETSKPY